MNSDNPREIRSRIRAGQWMRPTSGLAAAYAQANLVMLDRKYAFEFLLFCQRNPKPCPVLEVLDAGEREPRITAPLADITTDIPLYRAWKREYVGGGPGNFRLFQPGHGKFSPGVQLQLRACAHHGRRPDSQHRGRKKRLDVYHQQEMHFCRAVLGAAGRQYEADPGRACEPRRPGNGPLRILSRCARAHREPKSTRHSRPE